MANEIKQPTEAELQAKANAATAETYKKAVGETFTDGKKVAMVKEYIPSRLTNGQARQCFLVNYGRQNVSFFVPCLEFMQEFKPVEGEVPKAATDNNLPH